MIGPTRGGPFNVHEDLREAVERKIEEYRNLSLSLVVAANIPNFDVERIEEEALFGQRALRLRANAAGDAWTPLCGPANPCGSTATGGGFAAPG